MRIKHFRKAGRKNEYKEETGRQELAETGGRISLQGYRCTESRQPVLEELYHDPDSKLHAQGQKGGVTMPDTNMERERERHSPQVLVDTERESYVLFLRRASKPDAPYYTLEVEPDGTVRQKRTMYDRQKEDIKDAEKFLREWQKVISKRITAKERGFAEKSRILRNQEFTQMRENQVIIHTGDLRGQLLVDVLMKDLMENKEELAGTVLADAA